MESKGEIHVATVESARIQGEKEAADREKRQAYYRACQKPRPMDYFLDRLENERIQKDKARSRRVYEAGVDERPRDRVVLPGGTERLLSPGEAWDIAHPAFSYNQIGGRRSTTPPDGQDMVLENADPTSLPGVGVRMPGGSMDGLPPREIVVDIDVPLEEPAKFRGIVQAIESARAEDTITVNLNTPGGRTDAAQAVYVALLKTPARTRAKIINAASSGSIVALACDEIETTPFCTMMIHNASGGAGGKMGDMMASVSYRERFFREWFGQLYAGFLTPAEIQDVMKGQDLWLKENDIRARLESWEPIRKRMRNCEAVA